VPKRRNLLQHSHCLPNPLLRPACHTITTCIMQNKPNSPKAKMTLNLCPEKHYGELSPVRPRQNKANQTQFTRPAGTKCEIRNARYEPNSPRFLSSKAKRFLGNPSRKRGDAFSSLHSPDPAYFLTSALSILNLPSVVARLKKSPGSPLPTASAICPGP